MFRKERTHQGKYRSWLQVSAELLPRSCKVSPKLHGVLWRQLHFSATSGLALVGHSKKQQRLLPYNLDDEKIN
eukprot:6199099-Pleurochrysis_carterae.AAC.2